MKLISVNSVEVDVSGTALMTNVTVAPVSFAFDGEGAKVSVVGEPEELTFVYQASDPYGLSPVLRGWLTEHLDELSPDVQAWLADATP